MIRVLAACLALLGSLPAGAGQRFAIKTIPVGASPEHVLAVPGHRLVFVAVTDDRRIAVLGTDDDAIAASIPVAGTPHAIAYDPIGDRLLVVMPLKVEAFEGKSPFRKVAEVDIAVAYPSAVTFDVSGNRLLLTGYPASALCSVTGHDFKFEQGPLTLEGTWQLYLESVSRRLVVPEATGVVRVLNADDLTEQSVIQSFRHVYSAVYLGGHDRLFVVGPRVPAIHVVDLATNLSRYVEAGDRPWGMVLDGARNRVYVGNSASAFVTRVDALSLGAKTIAIPEPARDLVLDGPASLLYAYDFQRSTVSVIDTVEEKFLSSYRVGAGPREAVVDPRTRKLYTANMLDGTVSVLGPLPDPDRSEVEAVPDRIPADGASISLITVIPRDAGGNALGPGHAVSIEATAGSFAGPVVDHNDGSYTRELVSSTQAETAIVTAEVDGVLLNRHPRVAFYRDGWAELVKGEPEWGFTSGGTRVTLTGRGFLSSDDLVRVFFDGVEGTVVAPPTDTEILCDTPAHDPGVVDVSVLIVVGGQPRESFLRGGYTYVEEQQLNLVATKGTPRDHVDLRWSDGPCGPVRLLASPVKTFSGSVSEIAGLAGPGTTLLAPASPPVVYYRVTR